MPKYSLKEISVEGKLLTSAAIIGGNILEREVGIKQAAIFKQICRRCDNEYFKLYEMPGALLELPSSQIMGQIASKNLLREVAKAKRDIGFETALGETATPMLGAMTTVRSIDVAEDEKALKTALRVGKTMNSSNAFHLVFHKVLSYTSPFAFQQMISPMADFEGGVINHLLNPNPNYRIEPLHVCVLPTKGSTVVMMFRGKKAKRYREFERQFSALDESEKLQAIVKLIFAYSEDVLISPMINQDAIEDENLIRLARMNFAYEGFGDSYSSYKRVTVETALRDYTISNLPNPPELLSREYAIKSLYS